MEIRGQSRFKMATSLLNNNNQIQRRIEERTIHRIIVNWAILIYQANIFHRLTKI